MYLKQLLIGGAFALSMATTAQAASITFTTADLVGGTEDGTFSSLSSTVGDLNLTTNATEGGAVRVYNAGSGAGIYIGAITSGAFNTVNNKTAPESGRYSLDFNQDITSITFMIDYLTENGFGEEVLFGFATDNGAVTLGDANYTNASFTKGGAALTALDVANQQITTDVGRGRGTLTYTGSAFSSFAFDHTQDPQNIGFTITSVSVELAPVPLPAGFPLIAVGLGAFAFMRRRQRIA